MALSCRNFRKYIIYVYVYAYVYDLTKAAFKKYIIAWNQNIQDLKAWALFHRSTSFTIKITSYFCYSPAIILLLLKGTQA
jgi:hypothetical protein